MATRWTPSPPPSAAVEPVDTEEVQEPDGRTSRVFITGFGVRFVRITEQSGFVFWMREVRT